MYVILYKRLPRARKWRCLEELYDSAQALQKLQELHDEGFYKAVRRYVDMTDV